MQRDREQLVSSLTHLVFTCPQEHAQTVKGHLQEAAFLTCFGQDDSRIKHTIISEALDLPDCTDIYVIFPTEGIDDFFEWLGELGQLGLITTGLFDFYHPIKEPEINLS